MSSKKVDLISRWQSINHCKIDTVNSMGAWSGRSNVQEDFPQARMKDSKQLSEWRINKTSKLTPWMPGVADRMYRKALSSTFPQGQ
mmetsp:Transcript_4636/g.6187  ORF Transcript_4636/g.6187 Transcript_4636/m.6187 type:complete len:86 (+) Transcript_4636:1333-1590(+)